MESTTTEQVAGTDDVERVARAVRKSRFARIGQLSSYDPEIAPTENELDDVRAAIAALSPPATPMSIAAITITADQREYLEHIAASEKNIDLNVVVGGPKAATPQAPEDVRERARRALFEGPTPSIWIDTAVEALSRAHLLARPVTVTIETARRIWESARRTEDINKFSDALEGHFSDFGGLYVAGRMIDAP